MLTIFHSSLFLFFPLWTRRLKMHFEQRCAKRQSAHFKTAPHTMGPKNVLNSHLTLYLQSTYFYYNLYYP
jgi:hypothetical protein